MGGGRHTQQRKRLRAAARAPARDRRAAAASAQDDGQAQAGEAPCPRAAKLAAGETPVPAGCKPGSGMPVPAGGKLTTWRRAGARRRWLSMWRRLLTHKHRSSKGTSLVIPSEPGTPEEA